MALMPTDQEAREGHHDIEMRFLIAQDGRPDEGQLQFQKGFREEVHALAQALNTYVADSREKSLALTHLEEALMWAGKAIFR